jgi:hypothetical protein
MKRRILRPHALDHVEHSFTHDVGADALRSISLTGPVSPPDPICRCSRKYCVFRIQPIIAPHLSPQFYTPVYSNVLCPFLPAPCTILVGLINNFCLRIRFYIRQPFAPFLEFIRCLPHPIRYFSNDLQWCLAAV